MSRKKYMLNLDGEISRILHADSAEIVFELHGKMEKAIMKSRAYFHDGRLIPNNQPLCNYVRRNMQVKFSCHRLEGSEYDWYTVMCRASNESPLTETTVTAGLCNVFGTVRKITKRHGVLSTLTSSGDEENVAFLASKVYLDGKRFPSTKMINTEICLEERLILDALPCFPEENKDNCKWFSNLVYRGKRPQCMNSYNMSIDDSQNEVSNKSCHQFQQDPLNLKSQLLKCTNVSANNPRNLFTTGYGFLLGIISDEFGILLGCFRKNVYQTILFHRKSAFLFKVPLTRAKLSDIFVEGDRMKFIAVGAPTNFYTDWIAIQVSVPSSFHEDETTDSP